MGRPLYIYICVRHHRRPMRAVLGLKRKIKNEDFNVGKGAALVPACLIIQPARASLPVLIARAGGLTWLAGDKKSHVTFP